MEETEKLAAEERHAEALAIASEAGHILLENGAEISRVEETMERIASHYGVDSKSFFVLSNGIFTTSSFNKYANVEFIPFKGTQLDKVVAVNQLSRDIVSGKHTLEEARFKLKEIRAMKPHPHWEQVLASALGSAGFCIVFGGGLLDCAASFVCGVLLWLFVLYVTAPHMSKIVGNIVGGFFVTTLCILFHRIGFGKSLPNMIIGAIIPLIPGVPFVNGVRDVANEDYIAGATRLLDAMLVFFCIAAGVALAFVCDGLVFGKMNDRRCLHLPDAGANCRFVHRNGRIRRLVRSTAQILCALRRQRRPGLDSLYDSGALCQLHGSGGDSFRNHAGCSFGSLFLSAGPLSRHRVPALRHLPARSRSRCLLDFLLCGVRPA